MYTVVKQTDKELESTLNKVSSEHLLFSCTFRVKRARIVYTDCADCLKSLKKFLTALVNEAKSLLISQRTPTLLRRREAHSKIVVIKNRRG